MSEVSFHENLIQFSSSIYGVLDNTESTCISPYSVTAAFMLVMIGANGNSRKQISTALFKNSELSERHKLWMYRSLNKDLIFRAGKDNILATANRLFVDRKYRLKRRMQLWAMIYFGARVRRMDFAQSVKSAQEMNAWISYHTRGQIMDLVDPLWLDRNTIMLIINAVYFRGTWKTEFNPKHTEKRNFNVNIHHTIKVDMMKMNEEVPYVLTRKYSAISLPYKGDNFAMVFIAPNNIDGLSELEDRIRWPGFFPMLASSLQNQNVTILIPKFVIKSDINLKEKLPKLRVNDIFIPGKANFSRLIRGNATGVYVNRAIHQVIIEVNEKGTEGSAATVVQFGRGNTFIADRPFLFYLRDIKTGVILFIGRYKPT